MEVGFLKKLVLLVRKNEKNYVFCVPVKNSNVLKNKRNCLYRSFLCKYFKKKKPNNNNNQKSLSGLSFLLKRKQATVRPLLTKRI